MPKLNGLECNYFRLNPHNHTIQMQKMKSSSGAWFHADNDEEALKVGSEGNGRVFKVVNGCLEELH